MVRTESRLARMSRRAALAGAALATLGLAACGGGSKGSVDGDMAKGAPEGAKVTVVEYASITCAHCATWQATVWPEFKAKYVDNNKVRFVFRELPTPPIDAATAGFLVARCAGEDKYFDVVHQLMSTQQELFTNGARDWLLRTAQAAGLSEDQFNTCVTDKDGIAAMEKRVLAARDAGVTGTPAFFVNGTQVGEGGTLAALSTAIDAELAK